MKDTAKRILGIGFGVATGVFIFDKIRETKQFKHLVIGHEPVEFTPTLMLHGVHGDKRTMQGIIQRWNRQGLAYKALEVEVASDGEMFVNGTWNKRQGDLHPIIQVFFDNNDAPAEVQAAWLTKVMRFLYMKLDVEHINLLGHSMGGVASLHYLTLSVENQYSTPHIEKFITLGSPFKGNIVQSFFSNLYGLEKDGERSFDTNYAYFMAHRQTIPRDIDVLNIYGNLEDGSESDGIVEVQNAKALYDILGTHVLSYEEEEIKGLGGQHTLLHENSVVDQRISEFLWEI